ncbi:MAG: pantoate--beta-alanine ligase [Pseudomonadota bacterium]
MKVISKISELRTCIADYKRNGQSIGFVPTMGNLHKGHVSLVERSKKENNITTASIFVNPTQFGPNEDFNKYPRTLENDLKKLTAAGCDLVFTPDVNEMYPDGLNNIFVSENKKSTVLCGKFRPGHFSGVLTVVAKLLGLLEPDKSYFGLKDYQQYILIKDMAAILDLGTEIIGCPIIRESDGLAMSSRNNYLSGEQKSRALMLSKALLNMKKHFDSGNKNVTQLKSHGLNLLSQNVDVQYVEVVDPNYLTPVKEARHGDVITAACFCDNIRLIDNIIL